MGRRKKTGKTQRSDGLARPKNRTLYGSQVRSASKEKSSGDLNNKPSEPTFDWHMPKQPFDDGGLLVSDATEADSNDYSLCKPEPVSSVDFEKQFFDYPRSTNKADDDFTAQCTNARHPIERRDTGRTSPSQNATRNQQRWEAERLAWERIKGKQSWNFLKNASNLMARIPAIVLLFILLFCFIGIAKTIDAIKWYMPPSPSVPSAPSISVYSSETSSSNKVDAWLKAKQVVTASLTSPSTADFGSPFGREDQDPQKCVRPLANGKYKVTGWVDSQNGYGGIRRVNWTVIVMDTGGGWSVIEGPLMMQR